MALTALEIKNAAPGMHADGNGLYLRVQEGGSKSWIFRYQINGRRREMGLGTLEALKAPEARLQATQLKAQCSAGHDPLEQRNAAKNAAIERSRAASAQAITFRQMARAYIESHSAGWRNEKHIQQWHNTLETYAGPTIGDMPVGAVNTEHVLAILSPIWQTRTETASRLRGRLEAVLDYAKVRGLRSGENPAQWRGHLATLLAPPSRIAKVDHHPALPYTRAADFMRELRHVETYAARALEFLILTAVRSQDVRCLTWAEIDPKTRIWRLPRERQKIKNRRLDDHHIPLSSQAFNVLQYLGGGPSDALVFQGAKAGQPLSDMTMSAIIRRKNETALAGKASPPWIDPKCGKGATVHGFRSTFRDWAAEVGQYPRELAEHALAHNLISKVEAAYQRGSMIDRRRPMMQAWADYLDQPSGTVDSDAQ